MGCCRFVCPSFKGIQNKYKHFRWKTSKLDPVLKAWSLCTSREKIRNPVTSFIMADQINLQLTKGRWVRGQETREIRLIDSCLTTQCFLEGGVKCKPINQWLYLKLVKYCMLQYTLPSRGVFSNPFRPLVVEYQCNVSRKENSVLFDPLRRHNQKSIINLLHLLFANHAVFVFRCFL